MGWSATEVAFKVMERIEKECLRQTKSQNMYRDQARTFMIEWDLRSHDDGGIEGVIIDVSTNKRQREIPCRISGAGNTTGPTHFRALAGNAPHGYGTRQNPSLPRGFSLSASEVRAYGKQVTLPKIGFQTKVDLIASTHSFPRSCKEAWLTHDTNGYYLIAIEPKPAWMKNPTSMRAVHRGSNESDSAFAERAARIASGMGSGSVNFGNGPISNVTPASARGSKKATY